MKTNNGKKVLKRVLKIFLYGIVCWFALHIAFTIIDGLTDNEQSADCILIFGNTVNEDGSLSARLKSRLDKGLELYHAKLSPNIMVSGGKGKEGHDEAKVMKQYLIDNGVRKRDIIADSKGNNTLATAIHYHKIAKRKDFESVIVVSQFYHITRTKYALKKVGISKIYSSHASYFEIRDLYSIAREFIGFYWYVLATPSR